MAAQKRTAVFAVAALFLLPVLVDAQSTKGAKNGCSAEGKIEKKTIENDCVACLPNLKTGKQEEVGMYCTVSGGGDKTKAPCYAVRSQPAGRCKVTYCAGKKCFNADQTQRPIEAISLSSSGDLEKLRAYFETAKTNPEREQPNGQSIIQLGPVFDERALLMENELAAEARGNAYQEILDLGKRLDEAARDGDAEATADLAQKLEAAREQFAYINSQYPPTPGEIQAAEGSDSRYAKELSGFSAPSELGQEEGQKSQGFFSKLSGIVCELLTTCQAQAALFRADVRATLYYPGGCMVGVDPGCTPGIEGPKIGSKSNYIDRDTPVIAAGNNSGFKFGDIVEIKNRITGESTYALVGDVCPACGKGIDITPSVLNELGSFDQVNGKSMHVEIVSRGNSWADGLAQVNFLNSQSTPSEGILYESSLRPAYAGPGGSLSGYDGPVIPRGSLYEDVKAFSAGFDAGNYDVGDFGGGPIPQPEPIDWSRVAMISGPGENSAYDDPDALTPAFSAEQTPVEKPFDETSSAQEVARRGVSAVSGEDEIRASGSQTSVAEQIKPPGDDCKTLNCWYKANGKELPSVSQRPDYDELGCRGGTTDCNDKLLSRLQAEARVTYGSQARAAYEAFERGESTPLSPVQFDANDQPIVEPQETSKSLQETFHDFVTKWVGESNPPVDGRAAIDGALSPDGDVTEQPVEWASWRPPMETPSSIAESLGEPEPPTFGGDTDSPKISFDDESIIPTSNVAQGLGEAEAPDLSSDIVQRQPSLENEDAIIRTQAQKTAAQEIDLQMVRAQLRKLSETVESDIEAGAETPKEAQRTIRSRQNELQGIVARLNSSPLLTESQKAQNERDLASVKASNATANRLLTLAGTNPTGLTAYGIWSEGAFRARINALMKSNYTIGQRILSRILR